MAKTTTALGPLSKLLDGDTGQLLGIIDAEGRPFTPLPVLDFTAAQLSAMAAAGGLTPFATYIPSDASPPYQLWARSASELVTVGSGAAVSSEYHAHFFAPLAIDSDTTARDISGALSDGAFQANLSAATAWATAGFLTQPNPSVASELSLIQFPAISWDWAAGDSLFLFWVGRMTPEGTDQPWGGDTSGYAAGSGIKVTCTTDGKMKVNAYASPSTSVFGPMSTNAVFEAGVTHSLAICFASTLGIAMWTDGARNAGHASGYLMPGGGPCSTVNAVPFKLGGDGSTAANIQNGVAMQTKAFVMLKGRRGRPPAIADMDALVAALHRNPQALVSAEAW
jgi:hypothetical protein